MKDLVIRKKDIVNLGRKTMKEVYELLNDEYMLKTFEKIVLQQKSLETNLIDYYLKMKHKYDDDYDYDYDDDDDDEEYLRYKKEKKNIFK